jgi:hypothetical protein
MLEIMKQILIVLCLLVGIAANSQQLIRGYSASFAYGLLNKGDDFTIKYEGLDYIATANKTEGISICVGFPFDYGVYRHRFLIFPGLDLQSATYFLDLNQSFPSESGIDSDSLRLESFMIVPQVGLMYKYHFYLGPVHLALGFGVDAKFPLGKDFTITTKEKTEIITYGDESVTGNDIVFNPNTVYSNLQGLGLHFNPKINLDIFATRFFAISFFYNTSPLTTYTKEPVIRGFIGIGASFLVHFGKEDNSRLLQYYKN